MITVSEDGTTATVAFPWPTNDTSGRIMRAMASSAVEAFTAAGHRFTGRPVFADLRQTGTGWEFLFTVTLIQEVAP